MNILVTTLYLAGAIIATLVLSTLFCRHRFRRKKKSFVLTALASAVLANATFFILIFLSARFYAEGWHVFSAETWKYNAGQTDGLQSALIDAMIFIVVGTVFCILPALGVALYYVRSSKKDGIEMLQSRK